MFVVYHVASTMEKKSFKFSGHAAKFAAKMNAKAGKASYAFAHAATYVTSVVKPVAKVNMMSGKTYFEPSNTPVYCSPASESYWSM